jgi:hypothetical protein
MRLPGGNWSMTKGENHCPAPSQQACDYRHGLPTLLLIEMHPDSREHYNVEFLAVPGETRQIR